MTPLAPPFGHPRSGKKGFVPRNPILGTVSDLSAAVGDGQVTLTWSAPVGIDHYDVQYKTSASGTWLDFQTDVTGESHPEEGYVLGELTNGTAYDFRVIAYDGLGDSTTSNTDSETPTSGAAEFGTITDNAVTGVTDTTLDGSFTQVQDDEGNPAKYALRIRSPTISDLTWGEVYDTEIVIDTSLAIGVSKTYQFTGLIAGTAYETMIVPYRGTLGAGPTFGDFSNAAGDTTTGSASLGTISDLSAGSGDSQIPLSWSPAENATSHQPQYKESSSGTWLNFGSALGGSASSVTVTGLTNGTSYDFRIEAGDGSTTTTSNVESATPAVAGSEPIFNAGTDTSFFYDDFESYGSTQAILDRYIERHGSNVDLATSGAHEGSQSVRFTYPGTSQQQDVLIELNTGDPDYNFPGSSDSPLIITRLQRWQSGYVFTNTGSGWFGNTSKQFLLDTGGGSVGERMTNSVGKEGSSPSFVPSVLGLQVAYGDYGWPQNMNRGTGSGQFSIVASGSEDTRTTDIWFDGSKLAGDWMRITLRLTASPTDFNQDRSPTSNARGRIEMWITKVATGTTIQIIDWDGNDSGKQEFGFVNVPYNTSLAPNFAYPSTLNCRPPSAQWSEYDALRIWKEGA